MLGFHRQAARTALPDRRFRLEIDDQISRHFYLCPSVFPPQFSGVIACRTAGRLEEVSMCLSRLLAGERQLGCATRNQIV